MRSLRCYDSVDGGAKSGCNTDVDALIVLYVWNVSDDDCLDTGR